MFAQFMRRYAAELDETMRRVVQTVSDKTPDFGVMLRYPLGWSDESGRPYDRPTGKRIRPLFLLLCAEAAGGDWHNALPAAAAVELLHNFSLIHDDIEDNSPTRHGRPTVWKIWGVANGINAGDALFALAYIALSELEKQGVSAENILKVWRVFNRTVLELTRGQHLDMRFEHQESVTGDDYISMISGKSAALVAACAEMGALIATGDERLANKYAVFGLNIGIAFQIRDDILGIWGDPALTGKSVATDILSRKKSLPVIYGLSRSETLRDIYKRENFGEKEVEEAVKILDSLGAYQHTVERESHYYRQAVDVSKQIQAAGKSADYLKQFLDTLFQRSY